jgi:hypothetical protein
VPLHHYIVRLLKIFRSHASLAAAVELLRVRGGLNGNGGLGRYLGAGRVNEIGGPLGRFRQQQRHVDLVAFQLEQEPLYGKLAVNDIDAGHLRGDALKTDAGGNKNSPA